MEKLYRINEVFYSLQGEGWWTGHAAIFVRMSGCNLKCHFCDTDFTAYQEMTAQEIVAQCQAIGGKCKMVVLTGGEPTLQVDDNLVDALHKAGYWLAMETNGTHPYPQGIDWVTCSPKVDFTQGAKLQITSANELKLVFDDEHKVDDYGIHAEHKSLQPCDTGDEKRNHVILAHCIEYIKQHPDWNLSLQVHKWIDIR